MTNLETIFPSMGERMRIQAALKRLGFDRVEIALSSDLGETYFFVPLLDLNRIGSETANLAIKDALPARKTWIGIKPPGTPTIPFDVA